MLTSYPPANLNRDDLGRPKTAIIGGTTRLRISSQSLKRAWRTSSVFQEKVGSIEVDGRCGIRTKRYGESIYKQFIDAEVKEKNAIQWTRDIAGVFGKIKSEKEALPGNLYIEQLAFISPEEQQAVNTLIKEVISNKKAPEKEQLKLLRRQNTAADIALFGRMLASDPLYNIEAAAQVAHAFSVQKVIIEDDFFTAVDDLNKGDEEVGAGHMGDTEFASGIFYTYINIDREQLQKNLSFTDGNSDTWNTAIQGIVEAAATVAPTGKQNSFGSRAYAHYIMAELGNQQPRTLSLAFINHINGDILAKATDSIESVKEKMDKAYGKCSDESAVLNVLDDKGSLQELLDFCVKE